MTEAFAPSEVSPPCAVAATFRMTEKGRRRRSLLLRVFVPDLTELNTHGVGLHRSVCEVHFDAFFIVLVIGIARPVDPFDHRGQLAVIPDNSVAFAKQLRHDVFDLALIHGILRDGQND